MRVDGIGSAVPRTVVNNNALEKLVHTSDEWISTRTGIKQRFVAAAGDSFTSLAADASLRALRHARTKPEEVDMIVCCTSSPDDLFGSAGLLQHRIGASHSAAFDLTAACSGFVVGLTTAAHFLWADSARNILVVGGDALSRMVDWRDRATCVLFGDGCGAALLSARNDGQPCSLLASHMQTDGSLARHLTARYTDAAADMYSDSPDGNGVAAVSSTATGSSGNTASFFVYNDYDGFSPEADVAVAESKQLRDDASGDDSQAERSGAKLFEEERARANCEYAPIHMSGRDVYRFAVKAVPETLEHSLERANLSADDLDWVVMHQANQRILDAAAERLGINSERVVSNVASYGNTSAGSVPIALDEVSAQGKLQRGQRVAIAGFGAGLTTASAILRWD